MAEIWAAAVIANPIKYHVFSELGMEIPDPYPYAYVMAGNGVIKITSTPHFWAAMQVTRGRIAGLVEHDEFIELRVPKIPAKWLRAVLRHVRRASHRPRWPLEHMYFFHFVNDNWCVEIPQQERAVKRVHYAGADAPTIVLDLHSHHDMTAHFSPTDNNDELGCRFYAVIGRVNSARPVIKLRLGIYGDFLNIPATCLFQGLGPFTDAEALS